MAIDDKIKIEKLQYVINREAKKILALSSEKIDKYEYLTAKEIFPTDQSRIKEQARFTCSPLGKAFEKQKQLKNKQKNKQMHLKCIGRNWLQI